MRKQAKNRGTYFDCLARRENLRVEWLAWGKGQNHERHLGPRTDRADVAEAIFAGIGSHRASDVVAHATDGHDENDNAGEDDDEDEDEAPETPLDEPQPTPVDDPPAEPIQVPYVVRRKAAGDFSES
jgi:hypothetical protein